ncbi:hypothetical protein T492DRAFT_847872 [Pavlovales sp. CCMP2436]|nr:hypothetical protein T492DRAFT_847872 [Pavlovales sp. CCMP2436]
MPTHRKAWHLTDQAEHSVRSADACELAHKKAVLLTRAPQGHGSALAAELVDAARVLRRENAHPQPVQRVRGVPGDQECRRVALAAQPIDFAAQQLGHGVERLRAAHDDEAPSAEKLERAAAAVAEQPAERSVFEPRARLVRAGASREAPRVERGRGEHECGQEERRKGRAVA